MRSSSGQHFAGLDHLRGLAAFLVILWHSGHRPDGSLVAAGQTPILGIFDEGHSGVALFMTLSGYLFAKLIAGRSFDMRVFLQNRAARLLPLLAVVLVAEGLINQRSNLPMYISEIVAGLLRPSMPMGGWSVVVEAHFYLLLPLLLAVNVRWKWAPFAIVAAMILLRAAMYRAGVQMEFWSYATLLGRLDQFVIGMAFARVAPGRATLPLIGLLWLSYAWFSASGGYYGHLNGAWVILPTVEGLGFGALIAWYDARPLQGAWTKALELAGKYSYSIYLLHLFVIDSFASFINSRVMPLHSIYSVFPFALIFFVGMVGVGHISYRLIEAPFLKKRRPYLHPVAEQGDFVAEPAGVPYGASGMEGARAQPGF